MSTLNSEKIIRGRQGKGSKETRGGIKQHGERKIRVPGERRDPLNLWYFLEAIF
jgi:hypothetical protein